MAKKRKKKTEVAKSNDGGRPRVHIDWRQVDAMLKAGCRGTEIAHVLGVHPDTLYSRVVEMGFSSFSAFRRQKMEAGNAMLLTKQFDLAMSGDRTMLIWLGKQRLGQSEDPEQMSEPITEIKFTMIESPDEHDDE